MPFSLDLDTSSSAESGATTDVNTPVSVGGVEYNPPTSIWVYATIGLILLTGLYIWKKG